jgi:5-enolpyruvylshikimate-3-phosphate synthase
MPSTQGKYGKGPNKSPVTLDSATKCLGDHRMAFAILTIYLASQNVEIASFNRSGSSLSKSDVVFPSIPKFWNFCKMMNNFVATI